MVFADLHTKDLSRNLGLSLRYGIPIDTSYNAFATHPDPLVSLLSSICYRTNLILGMVLDLRECLIRSLKMAV